jgi:exopolysaccharide biosynthesis polyprenyl glycosylphosphotransferase
MNRYRGYLRVLLEITSDLLAVASAWFFSAAVTAMGEAPSSLSSMASARPSLPEVLLLWVSAALFLRIYRESLAPRSPVNVFGAMRTGLFVSSVVLLPVLFSPASRGRWLFAVAFVACLPAAITAAKLLCQTALRILGRRWPAPSRVAIVGDQARATQVAWHLQQTSDTVVKGVILAQPRAGRVMAGGIAVLGMIRDLAEVINRERLDTLIVVTSEIPEPEIETCSEVSARMGVKMTWSLAPIPVTERINYSERCGMPLLEIESISFSRKNRMVKRGFDVAGSLTLLLLLAPVILIIAVLIRLTSPGPVLYTAPRVGRGGRYFSFLKFRSMCTNMGRAEVAEHNEKSGHLFKIRNDRRITPVGRILRRYSLDELPQLINVLMGDMSLVGPRPLPIEDLGPDGMSRTFVIWSEQRASVPPGITGLWQIRGRSELPFSDLVRHDLEYVHNWSLRMDVAILLQTPFQVLSGRGAY